MFTDLHGFLSTWNPFGLLGMGVIIKLALGYFAAPLWLWSLSIVSALWLLGVPPVFITVAFAVLLVFNIPALRIKLFTENVMKLIAKLKLLPVISETERTALEAGSIWVDGELFSGKPDFSKIMSERYEKLTTEEQSFLDNQCEVVCKLNDDQENYKQGDLSADVWEYLKQERFFGLIIPKEYGGRAFSALAHSDVISKLQSRSVPLCTTVMVPNSLGPAELLIHYGTKAQKDYYLPRLAKGEDIPCFALTEPHAGSDAGSMTSHGEVFRGSDGKLYMKLNWNKRYITLGAVATVVGLALKLRDPGSLLGRGVDLGITCVLVPANLSGVKLGRRHDPLGVPFYNCPIEGHDVVVSIDQIIGGADQAGNGWKMLMESLAAGRAISLPASSTGIAKFSTRVATAYAQVRHQFGISIGKFEGIEEVLARMAGMTYLLEAGRIFTVGAVDKGLKPAVISAIAKYNFTEISRKIVIDAMDVCGGAGISKGKRNLLANSYIAAPIGITVEGANILTRTLIIFGQGAIRCHPFAYKEVKALTENDIKGFDAAFKGHIGHVVRNLCRSVVLSLSRGHLAPAPSGPMKAYFRKLTWSSASFAILADIAMGTLGGKLKQKEKLTGRFADILSWMYLISATLRRFEAEGQKSEHVPFVHFAAQTGFFHIQQAFDGILTNFEFPILAQFFKYVIAPWGRINALSGMPADALGTEMVTAILKPGTMRDDLTSRAVYTPTDTKEAFGRLENAFILTVESTDIMRKIAKAIKEGAIPKGKPQNSVDVALKAGVITQLEASTLKNAKDACDDAIQVDSYELSQYGAGVVNVVRKMKAAC